MRRIPEDMTDRARRLRREATPAERALWRILSPYRPRFTRQLVVGRYILDLACREAKLAVELDGSQHLDQHAYDDLRTAWLESQGWVILRLWNPEVLTNPHGTAEHLLSRVADRIGYQPQAIPSKAGRERTPRLQRPLPEREG